MAHCRLSRTGRDAILAEVGAKGVTQGVQVDGAGKLVLLVDAGGREVQVEALDQVAGCLSLFSPLPAGAAGRIMVTGSAEGGGSQ